MENKWGLRLSALVIAVVPLLGTIHGQERTWTDTTGKFRVTAELRAVEDDQVVLRRSDGNEIRVPLERLSAADRAFLAAQQRGAPVVDAQPAGKVIAEIAETFYSDLRTQERDEARRILTAKAEELMKDGQSPLAGLPEPEAGSRAIRVGRVKLDGELAEVPVVVRAGGARHNTKLHLRYEEDAWRVFALSAAYPDGEKSINFEVAAAADENIDPLQAIVGQTLDLQGFTVDGRPLDMARFKDKVVLVDFWATWCGPCRAEMPNIQQNWDKYHDAGFEVIAISVDRDMKALGAYMAEEKPPWTVVADNHPRNAKSMAATYGIRGIPAFILLGRDGKVAAVHCRGPRLEQHVTRLLGEAGEQVSQSGPAATHGG